MFQINFWFPFDKGGMCFWIIGDQIFAKDEREM